MASPSRSPARSAREPFSIAQMSAPPECSELIVTPRRPVSCGQVSVIRGTAVAGKQEDEGRL
eukprot:scaffold61349_cov39-Tisochrysis_lutea.AAC.2